MLRLGGVREPWLPSAGVLAETLLLLVILQRTSRGHWQQLVRTLETHRFVSGLLFVVLLALALRLPGLSNELGHTPIDMDESRLASNVQHFFVTGELRHETVEHYPGAVFWLFVAGAFLGYVRELTRGLSVGADSVPTELFVQWARLCNVMVGAGIVAFAGMTGRRLFGERAGLFAAVIVAVAPLSIDTTTLVRNDPGMVLAVMATVYVALISQDDPRWRWVVLSGALAGIATAIKYSSVFAIVPALIGAGFQSSPRDRLSRTAVTFFSFVLAIAITNHFVWADFPTFLKQLSDQVAITNRRHWAATDNPAAFYVAILDRFGTGWPLLLLAASFAVYGLCAGNVRSSIFLSFPLLYIWFMTVRPAQFPRWVFPMLPFVAIAGAGVLAAIWRLPERISTGSPSGVTSGLEASVLTLQAPLDKGGPQGRLGGWRAAAARAVTVVVLALALWFPIKAGAVSFSRRVTNPTYALVERWLELHAAPQSVVILETGWLDLHRSPVVVRRVPDLKALLDGGLEQLAGAQWLIVPETRFGHSTLARLGLVQRVHASQGFRGALGYDYEIYAVPQLPGTR
jgi:4-amino-4-deoxy-L-arabinose transferase-like glycosyltransferase